MFSLFGVEIETVVRYNLLACIIVMNHSVIYRGHEAVSPVMPACKVFNPGVRDNKFREAVGVNATLAELRGGVEAAIKSKIPTLINCDLDPDADWRSVSDCSNLPLGLLSEGRFLFLLANISSAGEKMGFKIYKVNPAGIEKIKQFMLENHKHPEEATTERALEAWAADALVSADINDGAAIVEISASDCVLGRAAALNLDEPYLDVEIISEL